jgi:ribonuclease HI
MESDPRIMRHMQIDIYTDGGCLGNPGPGGWAYVAVIEGKQKRLSGFEPRTTNNRMELTAVISALRDVGGFEAWKAAQLRIFTDSQYVQRGITEWIPGWVRNGWRTSAGKPVKNQDLWSALKALSDVRDVEWRWVKGHVGNELNELCDAMVQAEIKGHTNP